LKRKFDIGFKATPKTCYALTRKWFPPRLSQRGNEFGVHRLNAEIFELWIYIA
jgi:hypothetical protein